MFACLGVQCLGSGPRQATKVLVACLGHPSRLLVAADLGCAGQIGGHQEPGGVPKVGDQDLGRLPWAMPQALSPKAGKAGGPSWPDGPKDRHEPTLPLARRPQRRHKPHQHALGSTDEPNRRSQKRTKHRSRWSQTDRPKYKPLWHGPTIFKVQP